MRGVVVVRRSKVRWKALHKGVGHRVWCVVLVGNLDMLPLFVCLIVETC